MMEDYAVIFDMDGVIAHTNPYHAKAFAAFFDRYGVRYSEQELIQHMYGKHNSYIMGYFFGRQVSGPELQALEEEKEGLFREIYRDHIEAINGLPAFLQDLRRSGFRTGVATSAPKANLNLIIGRLGFGPEMGSMLASEDVSRHKPDPEIYLRSAERLGVAPERCVVFEDSFSGVSAGLAAGAKVVGVLSSHTIAELPPCDYYIKDYSTIDASLVRRLVSGMILED